MNSPPDGRDWVSPLSSGKWRRKEIQIILPAPPKLKRRRVDPVQIVVFTSKIYATPISVSRKRRAESYKQSANLKCLTADANPMITQMLQFP